VLAFATSVSLARADTWTGLRTSLACCGDVNHDGVQDFVVASRISARHGRSRDAFDSRNERSPRDRAGRSTASVAWLDALRRFSAA